MLGAALILAAPSGLAQPRVIISEFMAENNGLFFDSFSNASDWLELQNTTGSPVNLLNWSLTDNATDPDKWLIPDLTLPPWGTRLVWASNANLRDPAGELHANFALSKNGEYLGLYDDTGTLVHDYGVKFPAQYENIAYGYGLEFATNETVTIVSNTSPVRAYCPTNDALGALWRQRVFDDSSWTNGLFPVGYATKNPAWLPEINFSLQSIALGKPGVYLRAAFDLPSASVVQSLAFEMTYDDGAAAFVNGAYACGANTHPYETLSRTNYAPLILGDPSTLALTDVTAVTNTLVDGTNVLAIHLMNANASSSDLFLKLRLASIVRSMVATNDPTFLTTATPGVMNGGLSSQRLPQTVAYSVASGIFTTNFTLELSGTLPGQTIHYTTNGGDPSAASALYTNPLAVAGSTHLRARVFDAAGRSGETATGHYTFASTDPATLAFATAIPILILTEADPILNGLPNAESTNYTAVAAHFIEPAGGSACLTSAPSLTCRAGVHVRGSSSSGFPKKPYALTFWGEDNDDKKVDLKGFPNGSDFALISCYNFDRTYLHDPLMFDLSRQAGRYAPRTRFVEVFLIGNEATPLLSTNYYGLFVLEERVKAGGGRVPTDEIVSPADVTQPALSGSYLFKCDRVDYDEFSWKTARKYPSSDATRYMVIGYPKKDTLQPEQSAYLVTLCQQLEDTLYSADPMNPTTGAPRYLDVPSWIDHHIFNMFSMGVDAFVLSAWFHKDRGGKVMAGPVWDFDRSLGPYGYPESTYPNVKRWDAWTFAPDYFFSAAAWWRQLHLQPHFRRLYWDRWAELRQGVLSETNLAATIANFKALLPEAAATRDYVRWGQWPTNDAFGRTHTGEVNWLTWFATNHAAWIDQNQAVKSLLLKPPVLSVGSSAAAAGGVLRVTLTAPEGNTIRYTLDGSDPALWNSAAHPSAHACAPGTTITLTASALLFARAYNTSDGRWSTAARAEYLLGGRYALPGDVQLSEVHYHPAMDDTVNHLPELTDRAYEFVEILNVADCDISLTGCRFPDGKPADELTLGPVLLKPGERAVVVRNSEAFQERYGAAVKPVACWLYGGLSDSGETVILRNRVGLVLDALEYKTGGSWPKSADGKGASLNRTSFGPLATRTPWQAAVPTPGRGGYWEWLGLRGLAALDGDDDGDGVANLIEYYTGADPQDPADRGRSDMAGFEAGQEGISISYRQAFGRDDVWASLQASEDLAEWFDIDAPYLGVESVGDSYLWTLELPPEAYDAYRTRFFRLRVWPATSSRNDGM